MLSCTFTMKYRKQDLHSRVFKKSMEIFEASSHKTGELRIGRIGIIWLKITQYAKLV